MMTWILLASNIATSVGLTASVIWPRRRQMDKVKLRLDKPKKKRELYGHPHDPVVQIRSMLPKLDFPYQWETWIDLEQGKYWFVARVVDTNDLQEDGTFKLAKERRLSLSHTPKDSYYGCQSYKLKYAEAKYGISKSNDRKRVEEVWKRYVRELQDSIESLSKKYIDIEERRIDYQLGV